ncbi:eukaryotic translation initiation factor 5B-like [Haliotis cracherodii]|uniref:eukaryotic translation initiation factor 5B-like n=1 Tax=Haliotis cracherodii TaxID=6455 RepID=UPI0039E8CC7B
MKKASEIRLDPRDIFRKTTLRKSQQRKKPQAVKKSTLKTKKRQDLGEQLPQLTFVKGIPYDILDEDYFDARQQNVLVLDDFLAEAKHDKHKQQIKLFARRIFPEHMDHFMAMYEKVAETPYGQLTIDLKPTTKDKDRLHVNLINEENRRTAAQSEPDLRREKLTTTESLDSPLTQEERLPQHQLTPIETDSDTSSETSLTMATACADCGVLIDNMHDLQRHIKHWCPANSLQPKRKRARLESDDDDSDFDDLASSQKGSGLAVKPPRGKTTFTNMEAEEWQNVGLQRIWKQVYDTFLDKMKLQKKQYKRQGRTQEWIERRMKLRWEDLVRSTLNYAMEYTTYFKEAPLFQNMLYNLGDMNPSTEQSVLKNKIKLLLKPKMKEILPLMDMPEIESETESDSVAEDNDGDDEEEDDDHGKGEKVGGEEGKGEEKRGEEVKGEEEKGKKRREKKGREKKKSEKRGREKKGREKKRREKKGRDKKGREKKKWEKKGREKKRREKKRREKKGREEKGREKKKREKKGREKKEREKKGREEKRREKKGREEKKREKKGREKKGWEKKGREKKRREKKGREKKGREKKEREKKGREKKGREKKRREKKGREKKIREKKETWRSGGVEEVAELQTQRKKFGWKDNFIIATV